MKKAPSSLEPPSSSCCNDLLRAARARLRESECEALSSNKDFHSFHCVSTLLDAYSYARFRPDADNIAECYQSSLGLVPAF